MFLSIKFILKSLIQSTKTLIDFLILRNNHRRKNKYQHLAPRDAEQSETIRLYVI